MGNIIYMRLYLLHLQNLPLAASYERMAIQSCRLYVILPIFCRNQSIMQDKLLSAGTVRGSSLRNLRQRCAVLQCYTAGNSSMICCRIFSTESVTWVAYLSMPGAAFAMA